ncbi:hypothetical protein CAC42_188 [Sphaceloma murrayae]|uniref:Uncharacterized protein n=1 Tax=Sphaceloma murrayae TaxID=2082308 RepID=A0A2K1QMU4_9PEZI|nr:hypothetical protein CAC42_188 [Sphaceloma murrayae]
MSGLSIVVVPLSVLVLGSKAEAIDLWHIDIDNRPAPSPELGPPLSLNASRDPSLLPIQISCIVAAYVFTSLIIGSLLLTVGRRLRRSKLDTKTGLSIEMVKPANRAFDPSPVSPPSDQKAWYSPKRLKKRRSTSNSARSASNPGSPGIDSIASFDPKVIDVDRQRRQDELEKLYAAVLAHDEAKQSTNVSQVELQTESSDEPEIQPILQTQPAAASRSPPRLITTAPGLRHLREQDPSQHSPTSPVSPRSPVRAIYPPDYNAHPVPTSPTSPIRAQHSRHVRPTSSHGRFQEYTGEAAVARPARASQISTGSTCDDGAAPRRLRRSLKKINIKAASHHQRDEDESDSARTPLTPRYYAEQRTPVSPPRSDVPSTPGTYESPRRRASGGTGDLSPRSDNFPSPAPAENYYRNNPYRQSSPTYPPQQQRHIAQISSPKMLLDGKPLSPSLPSSPRPPKTSCPPNNASNGTLGPLPFRAMARNNNGLISPGYNTKTTFLETRRDLLAPRTGMATPYSPYMPFTPLTPVTPRLIGRQERRLREREEAKRAIVEEDKVPDGKDMWGDGY